MPVIKGKLGYINTDLVASYSGTGTGYYECYSANGELIGEVRAEHVEGSDRLETPQYVADHTCSWVLNVDFDDADGRVTQIRVPVIAWKLERGMEPEPVCADPPSEYSLIEHWSDGEPYYWVLPFHQSFLVLDEAIEEIKRLRSLKGEV